MPFRLEPTDESLLKTARYGLDLSHDFDGTPEKVHSSFLGFVGDPPWSPGFVGLDWWTEPRRLDGAVMDELYAFMAMRVHVLKHEPGARTVAYVSHWSLPLATRMVQVIETTRVESGKTRLRYRVAYDSHRVFSPMIKPVSWGFKRWFELSFKGLERYVS